VHGVSLGIADEIGVALNYLDIEMEKEFKLN
jgi:hypothetical protein